EDRRKGTGRITLSQTRDGITARAERLCTEAAQGRGYRSRRAGEEREAFLAPVPVGVPVAVDPLVGRSPARGSRAAHGSPRRPAFVPHGGCYDRCLPGRGGV